MKNGSHLFEVLQLKKVFRLGLFRNNESVLALDGVNFSMSPMQIYGLVGESSSGKTTLAKTMIALQRPTTGEVRYEGQNIFTYDHSQLERFRSQVQMIFQDPYGSLNPNMTIRDALAEVLFKHKQIKKKECTEVIFELLEQVGLNKHYAGCFPHELSGGQRQKVAITRALAVEPKVLICDEPVSALDMVNQTQIIDLLEILQQTREFTLLLISHNMAFVKSISQITAVMYRGVIVEQAPTVNLFRAPLHPYTKLLLASIPKMNGSTESYFPFANTHLVSGQKAPGCRFYARCCMSMRECIEAKPILKPINDRWIACHFYS